MPTHMELWDQYFKKYNEESVTEVGHAESLKFYKDNRKDMDEGTEVFNPSRFSEADGHISML